MREVIYLLGRILFSLVFLGSGFAHLTQTAASTQYAEYKKVPNAKLMVQATGGLMVIGGLAVILGIFVDLAGLLLTILVLIYAFVMHRFWEETDPATKAAEQSQFMKNVSIAGAGLILAAIGFLDIYTMTDGVFQP